MSWKIYAVLSAVFASLVAILGKIGIEGIPSNLAVAIRTVVVLVFAWMIAYLTVPLESVKTLTAKNWVFLILSGLATGVSWLCYYKALQLGKASWVVPIDKMSVVLTVVLAFLILGEKAGLQVIIGGCLIVLGSLVMIWEW
ncbi:MAG: EamA family transporter [Planctomycetaceae bacterium]|nr:EamA family transporter [Planctomycetaceae bacterium]